MSKRQLHIDQLHTANSSNSNNEILTNCINCLTT